MKRIVPYLFNALLLFLGILLPYRFNDSVRFFFFHDVTSFFLISFLGSLIFFTVFDNHYLSVILSQIAFYLTVLLFFSSLLYSDIWTEKELIHLFDLFDNFSISVYDKNAVDYSLIRPHFNYPIGILILTVANVIVQSFSYVFSTLLRRLFKKKRTDQP